MVYTGKKEISDDEEEYEEGYAEENSEHIELMNDLGLEIIYGEGDDKKPSGSSEKASSSNASQMAKAPP